MVQKKVEELAKVAANEELKNKVIEQADNGKDDNRNKGKKVVPTKYGTAKTYAFYGVNPLPSPFSWKFWITIFFLFCLLFEWNEWGSFQIFMYIFLSNLSVGWEGSS